jgi:TonB-linked SusC/RagA family outer membrane protein
MKKYKIVLFFQLFSLMLFAQQRDITGTVTDASGTLLPGVNVILKGTNTGTSTGFEGEYKISVSEANAVLVFSYLGLETQEVTVGSTNTVNVVLQDASNLLDEVVVTALGIERETKSLVYARQALNTEGLTEARSTNMLNSLSGKVAGVSVAGADTPTGSPRVVIRGITSVTGNNAPLYVIDGIPMDNTQGDASVSVWNGGDDLDYGSPISDLSPDDIESIEVLKGANAGALYGSRASNGVILITTKKGTSKDGLGVSVNSNISMVSIREYPDYQYVYGAGDNGRMVTNSSRIDRETGLPLNGRYTRSYGGPMLGFDVMQYNGEVGPYLPRPGNVEEMYQTGATYINNVAIDKASETGSFRVSYTNTKSDFIVPGFEEQLRNNLTLNLNQEISKNLELNSSIIYTNDKVHNKLYQNGSNRNPANSYMYMHANMYSGNLLPYKDENGDAFSFSGPFHNPYWNLHELSNNQERNVLRGFVGLNWKINDEFSLGGKAMGDISSVVSDEFNNMGASFDRDGYYRVDDGNRSDWNYELMLNYKKDIGDFAFLGSVGANKYDQRSDLRRIRIGALIIPDVASISNANGVPVTQETDRAKTVNSVFFSTSAGYKELLYLDITGRNDWSSTLPAENNDYFYPSVGTSFIFSELIPENNIFGYGKLRVSYASVGSDTDPYNTRTTYGYGGNYNGTAWLQLDDTRKNPFLKPELTSSWEYGLDLGFLKNRITANVTAYKSTTENQIIEAQVTPTTGFERQVYNAGEIENKGFEVFIKAKPLIGKFKWDVDLNWSKNESLVVSLIGDVQRLSLRNWFEANVYAEVGRPFGEIYGRSTPRDPETGHYLVRSNGRNQRTDDQYLGNASPDWIAGLRNSFRYKGFSFSFLLDVKQGGDLYSGTMLKNTNFGMHMETLPFRDEYYFSANVLGENNSERRGEGLFGTAYSDNERVKGRLYENSALGVRDAEGNWVAERDADGNVIESQRQINPQWWGYDAINDMGRVTYDTSYMKLRELVLGYNLPQKTLENTPFRSIRASVYGRNLWTIYKNTPPGIDPESGTTSGNGQGLEYGVFLPTRIVGFNVKLSF